MHQSRRTFSPLVPRPPGVPQAATRGLVTPSARRLPGVPLLATTVAPETGEFSEEPALLEPSLNLKTRQQLQQLRSSPCPRPTRGVRPAFSAQTTELRQIDEEFILHTLKREQYLLKPWHQNSSPLRRVTEQCYTSLTFVEEFDYRADVIHYLWEGRNASLCVYCWFICYVKKVYQYLCTNDRQ